MIITIANQKGGVGKTTTAVTLAHGLAIKRGPVCLVDLDPQGQIATSLGLEKSPDVFNWLIASAAPAAITREARPSLAIIAGDRTTSDAQILLAVRQARIDHLSQMLRPLAKQFRYILIDTSPSVGGLQERALYAADRVIIPAATNYLSADAVANTMATMLANVNYGWHGHLAGILPTFYDERNIEDRSSLTDLNVTYQGQILAPIHRATVLAEAAAAGKTIWEHASRSRAAQEYANLLYQVI